MRTPTEADIRLCPDNVQEHIADLRAQLAAMEKRALFAEAELADASRFIVDEGYRKCDTPACNCGSWHGGELRDRAFTAEADCRTLAGEVRSCRKKLISTGGGLMVGGSLEDTLNLHNARAATDASGALARWVAKRIPPE